MQQKRYLLRIIECTSHLNLRIERHQYDIEEEYTTLKEAKEMFDSFKGSVGYLCLYDRVSNKSQEHIDEKLNEEMWKKKFLR